jgi:hypothetical protein
LNCIHHLLEQIPRGDTETPQVVLPEREYNANYLRAPVPREMVVPPVY